MQKTRELALFALLTALTAVATLFIRIPTPATSGYINLGDSMVFVSALLFGPKAGAIAGGLGSSLADLLGGYFLWAPLTLIIKGIEGFLVGKLIRLGGQNLPQTRWIILSVNASIVGGLWMAIGYFLSETAIFGQGAAIASAPGNLLQAVAGVIAGIPIATILRKANIFDRM